MIDLTHYSFRILILVESKEDQERKHQIDSYYENEICSQ
jgi:hypothetical protein